MARYDYDCAACGRRFEATHGVFEDGPTACPRCGSGPVRKAFSPPTIHFKGSGWAKKERQASTAARASRTAGSGTDSASHDGSSSGDAAAPSDGSTGGAGSASAEPTRQSETSDTPHRSDKPAKPAPAAARTAGGPGGE